MPKKNYKRINEKSKKNHKTNEKQKNHKISKIPKTRTESSIYNQRLKYITSSN